MKIVLENNIMFILSHKKYGEWEDFEVNSESSPNTSYLVTIDHDEKTCYCTCPDFQYRKDNLKFGGAKLDDEDHHCKHIKEVLNGKTKNSKS